MLKRPGHFPAELVPPINRRAKVIGQDHGQMDKSEIDVVSSKKHYVISLSKKETPSSILRADKSLEFVDNCMRDLCADLYSTHDSILNTPRRPAEIIWASAREHLKTKAPDKSFGQSNLISCLPLHELSFVDILSPQQYEKIFSYVQQNAPKQCPFCNQNLKLAKIKNPHNFSEGSKIIFAVSCNLLSERDNLSFEVAKDIYDFKRAIIGDRVIRIESSTKSADWFIVSTLSVSEYNQLETEVSSELEKFGQWSVFELNSNQLKLVSSETSSNYCEKCKLFIDNPLHTFQENGQIKAETRNDELLIEDFDFALSILNPKLRLPILYMRSEFYSLIYNLNSSVINSSINRQTHKIVANSTWIPLREEFFPDVSCVSCPDIGYQNWPSLEVEIDHSTIGSQINVNKSDKLWQFFGIEKALVTLVKSTNSFKSSDKPSNKIENLSQILSIFSDTNDIQIFNSTLSEILSATINNLHKTLIEDPVMQKGSHILTCLGLGNLRLSDSVRQLTSAEVHRLALLQTIYVDRRRKSNRVYFIENEHVSDLGVSSFNHFNVCICQQLTRFQKAFIVSAMRGKTASKNNTSNTEVYYEFSI